MRGAVIVEVELAKRDRITPAYAGSRRKITLAKYTRTDHPRVCGEQRMVHTMF